MHLILLAGRWFLGQDHKKKGNELAEMNILIFLGSPVVWACPEPGVVSASGDCSSVKLSRSFKSSMECRDTKFHNLFTLFIDLFY